MNKHVHIKVTVWYKNFPNTFLVKNVPQKLWNVFLRIKQSRGHPAPSDMLYAKMLLSRRYPRLTKILDERKEIDQLYNYYDLPDGSYSEYENG